MTHVFLYLIVINGFLFVYFFKQKELLRLVDIAVLEIKKLFLFLKDKHEKNKGIVVDEFSDLRITEKIYKRMQILGYFYLSDSIIKALSITAKKPIGYVTFMALCVCCSVLIGGLSLIGSIFYIDSLFIHTLCLIFGGLIGFYVPYFILRRRAERHLAKFEKDIPFFIDLMLICLDSGLTLEQSLHKVSEEFEAINQALAGEFARTYFELTLFLDQRIAFLNLLKRVPSKQLKTFIYIVIHNKDHGGSIYDTLHEISMTIYEDHIAKITEKAQKIPGRLTAFITICSIPILLIIVIGPFMPKIQGMFK